MVSKARDRPEYSTRAMEFVRRAGVPFQVVEYDFDSQSGDLALHAAQSVGLEPRCVFKTLMLEVDQQPVCVLIPADRTVAMKSVARCLNGKRAKMMLPAKAERYSGYHTGGINPFAQRHPILRTAVE